MSHVGIPMLMKVIFRLQKSCFKTRRVHRTSLLGWNLARRTGLAAACQRSRERKLSSLQARSRSAICSCNNVERVEPSSAPQTPALLQLSGIGDSSLLTPLGITPLIDLKTVGKNFQEQTETALGAQGNGFNQDGRGPTDAIAFPNIHELFGTGANASIVKIQNSIASWAQSQAHNALSAEALQTIFALQADTIINDNGAIVSEYARSGRIADQDPNPGSSRSGVVL